jgi:hypothetical protein
MATNWEIVLIDSAGNASLEDEFYFKGFSEDDILGYSKKLRDAKYMCWEEIGGEHELIWKKHRGGWWEAKTTVDLPYDADTFRIMKIDCDIDYSAPFDDF